ncbi:MAG: hypothetical protein AAF721_00380 [Myxococcota bacterium]
MLALTAKHPAQLLVESLESMDSRARRQRASNRLAVMKGSFVPLVIAKARELYSSDVVLQRVLQRVKSSPNWMRQLARITSVAYQRTPVRRIAGDKTADDAYRRVTAQAEISTRAKTWERDIAAVNTVVVLPVVRQSRQGPRLDYDILRPDSTELFYGDDTRGEPEVAVVQLKAASTGLEAQRVAVLIDDRAYHWFVTDHSGIRRVRTVPHNAGEFPGVVLRAVEDDEDPWASAHGEAVLDHTLEAACIQARMDWVRHNQDRKQTHAVSDALKQIPRQVAGAEGPLEIPVLPDRFRYQVDDLSIPIEEFVAHIVYHGRMGAMSRDVPPDMIDFREGTDGIEMFVAGQQHERVAALRDDDLVWYMRGEPKLARKTALVLRGANHPDAKFLNPSTIAERFEIEFGDLSFVDHPENRLRVLEKELDLGLTSTYRAYAKFHDVPFEKAREEVLAMANEEAELNDLYVRRNLPRRASERGNTIAQVQGREGGLMGGAPRKDDNNDERSDDPGGGRQRAITAGGTAGKRRAGG